MSSLGGVALMRRNQPPPPSSKVTAAAAPPNDSIEVASHQADSIRRSSDNEPKASTPKESGGAPENDLANSRSASNVLPEPSVISASTSDTASPDPEAPLCWLCRPTVRELLRQVPLSEVRRYERLRARPRLVASLSRLHESARQLSDECSAACVRVDRQFRRETLRPLERIRRLLIRGDTDVWEELLRLPEVHDADERLGAVDLVRVSMAVSNLTVVVDS